MSRILFLSRWFPDPPNNGSKLRIFHLLRGLAQRHEVTLLSFYGAGETPSKATMLPGICSRVEAIPWKSYDPSSLRARLGLLSPQPRFVVDTYSPQMTTAIDHLLSSQSFDIAIASQFDMALYSDALLSIPAIFEEVELATLYEQFSKATSVAARLRYGLTWAKHRRYLRRRLRDFAACTVVSQEERHLLQKVAPDYDAVSIIPNCIDVDAYLGVQADLRPKTLIFSGSLTYDANYDAIVWFMERVYPQIQQQIPNVKLLITGKHGNRPLPHARGVTLTGFVDDVRPLIAGATVSLAPIHSGGGTRLKILEAMALRTPVVATRKGAEGLAVQHGEHLLIADEPEQFAGAVVELLDHPSQAQRLADNAFYLVREQYNWSGIMPRFLDVVQTALRSTSRLTDSRQALEYT